MDQLDIYNEVLLKLHENPHSYIPLDEKYEAVCEELRINDLIFSVVKESFFDLGGSPHTIKDTVYSLNRNGLKLIANLPADCKEGPYGYFLKLKQDILDAEANFKELINKASQSTIRTSMWTLWLFIMTTVMAVATLVLAVYPIIAKSVEHTDLQQIQDRLRRLEQRTLQDTPATLRYHPLAKPQNSTLDSSKSSLMRK